MTSHIHQKLALVFAAIAAAGITLLLCRSTTLLNGWDDWRWKLLSNDVGSNIFFVDIDEGSLSRYGRWPWPRQLLGELFQKLTTDYAAAVVGVDIIFSEPGDAQSKQALANLDMDRMVWAHAPSMGSEPEIHQGVVAASPLCPANAPWPVATRGWLGLTEQIAGKAFRGGHIRPWPDPDKVVRTYQPFLIHDGECVPGLALAMYGTLMGLDASAPIARNEEDWMWGGIPLGLESYGLLRLKWRTSSIRAIPAHLVLEGKADIPAGAALIVGSTALGIGDFVITPVSDRFPGAAVHALALGQWLDRDFITRPSFHDQLIWALLVPLFLLFWQYSTRSAIRPWVIWGAVLLTWVTLSSLAWKWGIMLETKAPLMAALWLPAIQGYRFWQEKRAHRLIYQQFQAFLPESVLRELIESGVDPHKLAAESRTITVLFADLWGFTTLSENMPPKKVVALLNEVMEYLSVHIGHFGGTLDKFMGDGLMAFWGAPVYQEDHADRAVGCAMAILDGLNALNLRLQAMDLPDVHLGMGINSGQVAVGHMGSKERKSYTAIGDTVNTAARLQQLSGELQQSLLIGAETARRCTKHSLCHLKDIELKGKKNLVMVYIPTLTTAPLVSG